MLQLIAARPGITGDDLARQLETTDRAIRRHVAALREAGVPIDASSGRYGGYRLGRAIEPPPLLFTADEALGLVMAVLDGHHRAADASHPVGAALEKLLGVLPGRVARQASAVRHHARAAPDRAAKRPDPVITGDLVAALAAGRRVRLDYTNGAGERGEIDVDPWSVVVRHGRWYLLGHAHDRDDARIFRIDRLHAVTELAHHARPPEHLDPVAWLESHLATGWTYPTRVRFHATVDDVRPWARPTMGTLRPLDDGRCELTGTTDNPTMYANEWLAAVPFAFEVLDGPELRDAVDTLARRLSAATSG